MTASRRLHERVDVELPVVIFHDGAEIPASTVNLSLGGMLIKTERRVAFGANVIVRIELPALKEPAEIAAVVRWDRDGHIGVQFSSLRAKETWALNQLMKPR
ncbi:MAG: PilZ domain-containing protein [Sandaracinaceae bacterium]|nr:PilZ domain-containing protein [Sandaracinaceae bacterium]